MCTVKKVPKKSRSILGIITIHLITLSDCQPKRNDREMAADISRSPGKGDWRQAATKAVTVCVPLMNFPRVRTSSLPLSTGTTQSRLAPWHTVWAVFKTCVVAALQFRDRSLPLSTAVNETSHYCTKTWQYHKNVLRRFLRRHHASPRSLQKLFLEKTARAGPRSHFLQSKISLKESEMTLRLQEAILKVSRFPAGPPSSVPNPYNHPPSFSSYPTMVSGGYTPYRLTAIYPVVISLPSSITPTWAGCARCHRPAADTKMMVVVTSDAAAPLVRQYLSWTLCDRGRHLKYYMKSLLFFTTCSSSKIVSEQGQWGRFVDGVQMEYKATYSRRMSNIIYKKSCS